jgi:hypothetical protein
MRSLKSVLPLLLVFSTLSTFAQRKDVGGEFSVGPRLGGTLSASFKKHNNYNKSALELLLQFKDFNNVEDNDLDGFGATLLWEKLAPISTSSQLSAMIGGGPAFNFNKDFNMGIAGIIGFDWRLKMAPITLQLDWMPTFYFVNISTFEATNAAFTARFVLNRKRYKK